MTDQINYFLTEKQKHFMIFYFKISLWFKYVLSCEYSWSHSSDTEALKIKFTGSLNVRLTQQYPRKTNKLNKLEQWKIKCLICLFRFF